MTQANHGQAHWLRRGWIIWLYLAVACAVAAVVQSIQSAGIL